MARDVRIYYLQNMHLFCTYIWYLSLANTFLIFYPIFVPKGLYPSFINTDEYVL